MKPQVKYQWIADKSYQQVWDVQTSIHKSLIDSKMRLRNMSDNERDTFRQENTLLFCEHSPVFTLGKSGSLDHLLLQDEELKSGQIEFFNINRGGDITYHGPGQITGYPIFDLEEFFTDVHKYVRMIEEVIIRTIALYGLEGIRLADYTGVWLPPDEHFRQYRKICAIGVHLSRWVSMHGFAFNVNTELDYFDKIIPCGIVDEDKTVTSLQQETGVSYDLKKLGEQIAVIFAELFDFELVNVDDPLK